MRIIMHIGEMSKGGAERVFANLANFFADRGDEIILVTNSSQRSSYKLHPKVRTESLDGSQKLDNRIARTLFRISALRKIIKRQRPDLMLTFLSEPSMRIILANLFNRRKIIISVRNNPSDVFSGFANRLALKFLYPRANGIVLQTEDMKDYFNKKIQRKSIVIPNPVNPDFIVPQPYSGTREKTIVSVGRLEPQKNQKLLIDAFARISPKFPDYRLIIYGEGSLRQTLLSQIKNLNMEEKILLPGQVDDIKAKLYESGVFVLPSNYEGMPNALMEAMALGLPCIATDCPCGGPRFLMHGQRNGLLVKKGDLKSLEDAMTTMLLHKKKAIIFAANAHQYIKENMNPDNIHLQWLHFFQDIINGQYEQIDYADGQNHKKGVY